MQGTAAGPSTGTSRRRNREQLEETCKLAFGSGSVIMSEESKNFHQGVQLAGFDGVRFVLDATHDKEEDWTPFQNSEDRLATMSIEDARLRVQQLAARRKAEAEHIQLVAEQGRSRDRRLKLKRVFDRFRPQP